VTGYGERPLGNANSASQEIESVNPLSSTTKILLGAAILTGGALLYAGAQDHNIARPNPALTPGETVDGSDEQECVSRPRGYGTEDERRRYVLVMDSYHIAHSEWHRYQMDHLVPRCLCGADTARNLWPQPLGEAHRKDDEEKAYCRMVRDGEMSFSQAQFHFVVWPYPETVWHCPRYDLNVPSGSSVSAGGKPCKPITTERWRP
jgi:hypothetical protein